ncbi:MAG: OmpA family protein [Bacteroidetes bacterium]|nr:OmpA family protein [Bacteroidota bacterium]
MRIIVTLFFLCFSTVLLAQQKYTSKSNKAIKELESAVQFLQSENKKEALAAANKSIEKDPAFYEAYSLRANIYADSGLFKLAIADFETALKINPEIFPPDYLNLGRLYFKTQDYDKAKVILQKYIGTFSPPDKNKNQAEKIIKSCDFAKEAVKHPVPFNPVNMGPNVNSIHKDYNPFVSVDGETFVVTRTIPDGRSLSPTKMQEDFFISYKDGKNWTPSINMGQPINSIVNEGAMTLSSDGRTMVFTICEVFDDYGEGRQGMGSCDLFVSQKIGVNRWSKPRNLGPKINSRTYDTQPSLSSDGKSIYFASTRAGGQGESDLWVIHITDQGFTNPENLGPKINSSGQEDGVFIHPDNQTLYFASNGLTGMGGRDLFMCKRKADGTWGDPVNLGYPLNTSDDERTLFIDAKGDLAYFASDREGGVGDLDIYCFKLPESAKPTPVTYMKGIVYDEKTKKPLGAAFELIDLETGKQVVESFSDAKDGSFLVCLPVGKNYALKVSCEGGYLFYSENFELTNPKKGEDAFRKDVPMKKIGPGEKVILKNVFFATDSYELKPESKTELDNLVTFLNKNATMKIELGGHTDNQGAKAHNKTLSQNRANAVKDYLIKHGIAADRLTAKGYADEVPVDSNGTESGRANNRRTEFMVVQ